MAPDPASALATLMVDRRLSLGLSVSEAAGAAGLSANKWRELEAGSSRHREETLLKVARALQLPPAVVLAAAGIEVPRSELMEGIRSGSARASGIPLEEWSDDDLDELTARIAEVRAQRARQ